eukprot:COSAG01_NODE_24200_length_787_cov_0.780523_1_plen_121_part_10
MVFLLLPDEWNQENLTSVVARMVRLLLTCAALCAVLCGVSKLQNAADDAFPGSPGSIACLITVVDPAADDTKPPKSLQFGNYSFEISVMGDDGKAISRFKFAKPSILSIAYEPQALLKGSG